MSVAYGYCQCGCGQKVTIARKTDTRRGLTRGEPARFLPRHRPPEDRWEVDPDAGCWHWTRHVMDNGYGRIVVNDRSLLAHRWSYELHVGPIPKGMTLDHTCHTADSGCAGGPTCRHRRCVNPAHLEPVTGRENTLRGTGPTAHNAAKTHCDRGHAFTEENTYTDPSGRRECRTCRRAARNAATNGRRACLQQAAGQTTRR